MQNTRIPALILIYMWHKMPWLPPRSPRKNNWTYLRHSKTAPGKPWIKHSPFMWGLTNQHPLILASALIHGSSPSAIPTGSALIDLVSWRWLWPPRTAARLSSYNMFPKLLHCFPQSDIIDIACNYGIWLAVPRHSLTPQSAILKLE